MADATNTNPLRSTIGAFSIRTPIPAGQAPIIVGFTVSGSASRDVLIRAVGPTLAQFNINDFVPDPYLMVRAGAMVLAENRGWSVAGDAASAATKVGAFPLIQGSKDAAVVLSLNPGAYSLTVGSSSQSAGQLIIEIFSLP